jgi:hypothetical protein
MTSPAPHTPKVREFNDDDDYVPGRANKELSKLGKLPRTASEIAKEALDPRRKKMARSGSAGMGRMDGGRGQDSRMLQLQQLSMRRAPPQPNMPANWTQEDDSLLCAVTNEFGQNWSLVSDVLSSTCSMQGIHRKPEWCRARYQMLSRPEPGEDGSEGQPAFAQMITKQLAKELLSQALPVSQQILKKVSDALVQQSQRLKQKRTQVRRCAACERDAVLLAPRHLPGDTLSCKCLCAGT